VSVEGLGVLPVSSVQRTGGMLKANIKFITCDTLFDLFSRLVAVLC